MNTACDILVEEIRNRNQQAFQQLFCTYYPRLTYFAQGYILDQPAAEDLVQALFMHIWERADHFYIQTSLEAYLYQAVKNRCLNYLRDLRIQDQQQVLYAQALLHVAEQEVEEDNHLLEAIEKAIEQLPCRMAQIFSMKYLQGKKRKEIADALNLTENTVKTQLKRAKKKISEIVVKSALFCISL